MLVLLMVLQLHCSLEMLSSAVIQQPFLPVATSPYQKYAVGHKLSLDVCGAGEAEMQYGGHTKPYLLSHLRSTAAAQQAAAQAQANLPAKLRPFADFYMSHDTARRQAALDSVLLQLQGPLRWQYSAMWTLEAVSMLVLKVGGSLQLVMTGACTVFIVQKCLTTSICILLTAVTTRQKST